MRQRIDDKIGHFVREGGRQRPCRPERQIRSQSMRTQLSINHTENGNADRFSSFQENSWFRNPGLAPAAFTPDEGWLFLGPCRP
jgi:hypothetical protein